MEKRFINRNQIIKKKENIIYEHSSLGFLILEETMLLNVQFWKFMRSEKKILVFL